MSLPGLPRGHRRTLAGSREVNRAIPASPFQATNPLWEQQAALDSSACTFYPFWQRSVIDSCHKSNISPRKAPAALRTFSLMGLGTPCPQRLGSDPNPPSWVQGGWSGSGAQGGP